MGIPPSMFRGRVAGPGEPLWLDLDRAEILAFQRLDRATCRQCGTRHDEWVDEHGKLLDEPPYVALEHRCHGCTARDRLDSGRTDQARQDRGLRSVLVPPQFAPPMQ